jgi:hypothetical protein
LVSHRSLFPLLHFVINAIPEIVILSIDIMNDHYASLAITRTKVSKYSKT